MYLDTYALVEIANGNPRFSRFLNENFCVSNITLIEFYYVLLRDVDQKTADYWYKKLSAYSAAAPDEVLVEAMKFRIKNRSRNLSFFDCVGYCFAVINDLKFVTGDKEFKNMPKVIFIK